MNARPESRPLLPAVLLGIALLLFAAPSAGAAGKTTVNLVRASGGVRLVVKLDQGGSPAAKPPRRVAVAIGGKVYPLTLSGGSGKRVTTWKSAIQRGSNKAQLEALAAENAAKIKVTEQNGKKKEIRAEVKGGKTDETSAPPAEKPAEKPVVTPPVEPEPAFGALSATLELPGPLLTSPKEPLHFEVTADADSTGEAFIGFPEPQPDPTFGDPLNFAEDSTESPQTYNSGLPGYVTVGGSECASATLIGVVPVGSAEPGIRVAYDCAAGKSFAVNYDPRIYYWGFEPAAGHDTWKFSLSQRRAAAEPWSPLPSDVEVQVRQTVVELSQNIFINPPAPVVATEEIADGQVKLTTQGYNSEGVKNEATYQSIGYFELDGEILELKEGAADNLRGVEREPLEVNGCIWETAAGSDLEVVGDDATDTITANNLLQNGDVVIFTAKTGGSAVQQGAKYYVINRTPTSFQISIDGKTAANLGSDIVSPSTVARQTVSYPPGTPPLICEDINVFGVIATTAPPQTFHKAGDFAAEIGMFIALSAGQSSMNNWGIAQRECLAVGGSFTEKDGPTPGNSGIADWRCDFSASRGMTRKLFLEILHGWSNKYNEQDACATGNIEIEENYPSGGGADDLWCPLAEV